MRSFMIVAALVATVLTVGTASADPYRPCEPERSSRGAYGTPGLPVGVSGWGAPAPVVYGRAPYDAVYRRPVRGFRRARHWGWYR